MEAACVLRKAEVTYQTAPYYNSEEFFSVFQHFTSCHVDWRLNVEMSMQNVTYIIRSL